MSQDFPAASMSTRHFIPEDQPGLQGTEIRNNQGSIKLCAGYQHQGTKNLEMFFLVNMFGVFRFALSLLVPFKGPMLDCSDPNMNR